MKVKLLTLVLIGFTLAMLNKAEAVDVKLETVTVRDLYAGFALASYLQNTNYNVDDAIILSFKAADKMIKYRNTK